MLSVLSGLATESCDLTVSRYPTRAGLLKNPVFLCPLRLRVLYCQYSPSDLYTFDNGFPELSEASF